MTSLFFQQIMEDKEIQRKKVLVTVTRFLTYKPKKNGRKNKVATQGGSKTLQKYVACFKKITTFKKKYMK